MSITVHHQRALYGEKFSVRQLIEIDNPLDYHLGTVAHVMVSRGHRFSVDELMALKDGSSLMWITISLLMAQRGHRFSYAEIHQLGNPVDWTGASLAHWSAWWGQSFTIEELCQVERELRSRKSVYLKPYRRLGIDNYLYGENYKVGCELLFRGATVAHIMARKGYRFTSEEIESLGNPKDSAGLTIEDWMDCADYPLKEIDFSRYFENGKPKIILYSIVDSFKTMPADITKCIHCSTRLGCGQLEISVAANKDLSTCLIPVHDFTKLFYCHNCDWWCIREVWEDCEYHGACDYLIVSLEKDKSHFSKINFSDPDAPWQKALADPHLYDIEYPFPFELTRHFPGETWVQK